MYRLQEEYHHTDDTTQTEEEEQAEGALRKEKKFIVLNAAFLSYWSNAVVVVKGLSQTLRWACTKLAVPASCKRYGC